MGILVQEFRGIADLEYLVILVILEFLAIRDLELVDIVVLGHQDILGIAVSRGIQALVESQVILGFQDTLGLG